MDAPIDHVAEEVDDFGPHTGSARGQRVCPKQEDGPHDIHRKWRPDADRMAPDEIALEGSELVVRDTHGGEVAETGVDTVDRIVGSSDLRDDFRRLLHLPLRRPVEADGHVAPRHRDDVGDRQVVTGEPEGGYFRFSRYQAPSSV